MLVEPGNCLQEGLFLGILLRPLAGVTANGKPVHDTREQVDLVRLAALLEDFLGPVTLLGGEDGVGLGGRDGERALEAAELILINERRVGHVADADAVLKVPADILHTDVSPEFWLLSGGYVAA